MAQLQPRPQLFSGDTDVVDTEARHALGTVGFDKDGNAYTYLKGVVSTVAGSVVSFDEAGATLLLAANAVGRVAVAMAAIVANSYGWYQISGKNTITASDGVAADLPCFIDGTPGRIDDAVVTGDLVVGKFTRSADTANVCTTELNYPCVTNVLG